MIVGVSGYGYSGSGAIIDYLREFSDCDTSISCEFSLAHIPHGLQDLEYRLSSGTSRGFSSDVGIKEFLLLIKALNSPRNAYRRSFGETFQKSSFAYLSAITQLKWKGFSWDDSVVLRYSRNLFFREHIQGRVLALKEKINKRKAALPKRDIMYLSINPENFLFETKKYIRSLLNSATNQTKGKIVLDQPFNVNTPRKSMKYFDDPRAIIVDRDPRDLYILAKCYLMSGASFIPSDNVDDYILYHRLIRTRCEKEDGSDILRISFEDMVYDYDETALKIRSFLGLSDSQQEKKKYFDPAVSIENTQLFLKHPELAEDIRKIEKALPEYIYPFEKYTQKPKHEVDAF